MRAWKLKPLSLAMLLLSVLICAGALTFLGACVHEDGSYGACHWAGRACAALGGLCACCSLLALLIRDERVCAGLALAAVPTALLAALLPGRLIPLCMMADMRCRSVMKPSMLLLGLVLACLAAAQAALLLSKGKK